MRETSTLPGSPAAGCRPGERHGRGRGLAVGRRGREGERGDRQHHHDPPAAGGSGRRIMQRGYAANRGFLRVRWPRVRARAAAPSVQPLPYSRPAHHLPARRGGRARRSASGSIRARCRRRGSPGRCPARRRPLRVRRDLAERDRARRAEHPAAEGVHERPVDARGRRPCGGCSKYSSSSRRTASSRGRLLEHARRDARGEIWSSTASTPPSWSEYDRHARPRSVVAATSVPTGESSSA